MGKKTAAYALGSYGGPGRAEGGRRLGERKEKIGNGRQKIENSTLRSEF